MGFTRTHIVFNQGKQFIHKTTTVFFSYKFPFYRNKKKRSYGETSRHGSYLPRMRSYAGLEEFHLIFKGSRDDSPLDSLIALIA